MVNQLKSLDKALEGEILPPEKYGKGIPSTVKSLCLLGLTNKQIASHIGISLAQLETWRDEQPEIGEAMFEGRDGADAKVVESLYQRALGISVKEVKTQESGDKLLRTTIIKQLPPDVGAASLILRNHQSGKFKDTKEITGKVTFAQMLDELESGGG